MTVVQELAEMKDMIAAKDAELVAAQSRVDEQDAAFKAIEVEKAGLVKQLDDMKAMHEEALAKIGVELATEKQAHVETVKKLEAAEKALQNPAYAAAASVGSKQAVDEGGAEAAGEFATKADALKAYRNISDAKARAEFRKEHRAILGL